LVVDNALRLLSKPGRSDKYIRHRSRFRDVGSPDIPSHTVI